MNHKSCLGLCQFIHFEVSEHTIPFQICNLLVNLFLEQSCGHFSFTSSMVSTSNSNFQLPCSAQMHSQRSYALIVHHKEAWPGQNHRSMQEQHLFFFFNYGKYFFLKTLFLKETAKSISSHCGVLKILVTVKDKPTQINTLQVYDEHQWTKSSFNGL